MRAWEQVHTDIDSLCTQLSKWQFNGCIGLGPMGVIPAAMIVTRLNIPLFTTIQIGYEPVRGQWMHNGNKILKEYDNAYVDD